MIWSTTRLVANSENPKTDPFINPLIDGKSATVDTNAPPMQISAWKETILAYGGSLNKDE